MANDRKQPPGLATPTASTASLFARFQERYASSRSPPPTSTALNDTSTVENARSSSGSEENVAEEHGDAVFEELGKGLEHSGIVDGLREGFAASEETQMSGLTQAVDSTSLPRIAKTSESTAQEAPPSAADVYQTSPRAVSALPPAQPRLQCVLDGRPALQATWRSRSPSPISPLPAATHFSSSRRPIPFSYSPPISPILAPTTSESLEVASPTFDPLALAPLTATPLNPLPSLNAAFADPVLPSTLLSVAMSQSNDVVSPSSPPASPPKSVAGLSKLPTTDPERGGSGERSGGIRPSEFAGRRSSVQTRTPSMSSSEVIQEEADEDRVKEETTSHESGLSSTRDYERSSAADDVPLAAFEDVTRKELEEKAKSVSSLRSFDVADIRTFAPQSRDSPPAHSMSTLSTSPPSFSSIASIPSFVPSMTSGTSTSPLPPLSPTPSISIKDAAVRSDLQATAISFTPVPARCISVDLASIPSFIPTRSSTSASTTTAAYHPPPPKLSALPTTTRHAGVSSQKHRNVVPEGASVYAERTPAWTPATPNASLPPTPHD